MVPRGTGEMPVADLLLLNMRLQEASIQVAEQRHLIETLQNQVLAPQNTVPQGQLSNNSRYIKKNL